MGLHVFADGSLGERKSMSGAIQMLAAGPVDVLMARQHLNSPDSHTTEVVAASSALHRVVGTRGKCQELRIWQERPTPFYMDSTSTIFVANDEKAMKRSVWIARRTVALREGKSMGEIMPTYLEALMNCANFFTKYETYTRNMRCICGTCSTCQAHHPMIWMTFASPRSSNLDSKGKESLRYDCRELSYRNGGGAAV